MYGCRTNQLRRLLAGGTLLCNGRTPRFDGPDTSVLRAAVDARGGNHTATLRNANNDAAIELTVNAASATGNYMFRARRPNGVAAELSGSFVADSAILDTLARELSSLVHDSWAKA